MEALGQIHRLVGRNDDLIERLTVDRITRGTDAHADLRDVVVSNGESKAAHCVLDTPREIKHIGVIRIRYDGHELIAAVPGQKVVLTQLIPDNGTDLLEHLVAGFMAEGIIDRL